MFVPFGATCLDVSRPDSRVFSAVVKPKTARRHSRPYNYGLRNSQPGRGETVRAPRRANRADGSPGRLELGLVDWAVGQMGDRGARADDRVVSMLAGVNPAGIVEKDVVRPGERQTNLPGNHWQAGGLRLGWTAEPRIPDCQQEIQHVRLDPT